MKHKLITPETCTCAIDEYCYACDGGLDVCSVCGMYEGGLTTDCPGTTEGSQNEDIYIGLLDYREGEGWVKKPNPSNQIHNKREVDK